jgi:hypothetical protein
MLLRYSKPNWQGYIFLFFYIFPMVSCEGRGKKNAEIRCLSAVSFRYQFNLKEI